MDAVCSGWLILIVMTNKNATLLVWTRNDSEKTVTNIELVMGHSGKVRDMGRSQVQPPLGGRYVTSRCSCHLENERKTGCHNNVRTA